MGEVVSIWTDLAPIVAGIVSGGGLVGGGTLLVNWRRAGTEDKKQATANTIAVEAQRLASDTTQATLAATFAQTLLGTIDQERKRGDAERAAATVALQQMAEFRDRLAMTEESMGEARRELDDCNSRHGACEDQTRALRRRVDELEAKDRRKSDPNFPAVKG